ncbi:hypothetical protein FJT64_005508 [Amphibalanus amphitrite]|uniref:Apple domain-containing protein n=1 Tax=Amphibalanus amphitrite TaxID=1232801 RepID=A0A6A4W570_AMPAM|nr:hypothetical protein FJT64_005508 [Amphibalanus amphitrite]
MAQLRTPSLMLLTPLILTLLVVQPTSALVASARRGQDRRLNGVGPREQQSGLSQEQCQALCSQYNCGSFNYHPATGGCEVLSPTACESYGLYVVRSTGWRWFDVVSDLTTESSQVLWQREACVRDGRCRDSCLRRLGENCRHSDQCQPLVTGGTQCASWTCQCDADHWQFNETLCLPRNQQLFTEGTFWVWKKIVNGLCSTQFDLKASKGVTIVLAEAYTHYSNRYVFELTPTYLYGNRILEGVTNSRYASVAVSMLSSDTFRTLGMSWCSGQMRFWESGGPYRISWNDGSAFNPTHMAIYSADSEGRWRFPERLVDPWFGDWSTERIYSIPRDTFISRRRHEQDFWVEFECRITRDCFWQARQEVYWNHGNILRAAFGGWDNTASAVQRHITGVGWSTHNYTETPGILSATEFRKFRVHFSPQAVSMYRGDETEPFVSHKLDPPITINYDGPQMCCNVENIEYKLAKYDSGWSYEGGFRWGEDLVPE